MTKQERDIQRKLKVLRRRKDRPRGQNLPNIGVGRSSFCRWKAAYEQRAEAELVNVASDGTGSLE